MAYKVIISYPNGEKVSKLTCKVLKTATDYEEHLQRFFKEGTYTKSPKGEQFESNQVVVEIEET